MADYTDTRCPSIRLDSVHTVLPDVVALATCAPPDGIPRPIVPGAPLTAPVIARNPSARMEGRGPGHQNRVVATQPGQYAQNKPGATIFDHPDVGGRFTICVLFWGPEQYYDLHRRCLESIVRTVPGPRMDLRVASNELNQKSLAMIRDHVDRGIITKHYRHDNNAMKYPVMREMFYDPICPINTKWVIWFDDDSIADRTPDWLNLLSQSIVQHHRQGNCHMFGTKFVWNLKDNQRAWYESRPWFRKRPWRAQGGKPAPNGNSIIFATGGWWAITHEAIMRCDIPDRDIGHNGGDVCIGEQLYQGGYELKMFNGRKTIINTSSIKRRGLSMPHPGTANFVAQR
jgi:hypothetical protein